MKKFLLIGVICLTCSCFGADKILDPVDPPAAAKAATPPDINAVLSELLKRMPTPAEIKTPEQKDSWNDTLQTLSKEIVALIGGFLTLWKLLHDHHDRIDDRDLPKPTPDEQKILDKFRSGALTLLVAVCCFLATGCQNLKDAEAKMVAGYEAHAANTEAAFQAADAGLLQAQVNYATELHNERITDIQRAVAADPSKAADGIAAAASANATLQAQIATQNNTQNNLRAMVQNSKTVNVVQIARPLDAVIRKADNVPAFNAVQAAQSIGTTVQALIPPPTPISVSTTVKTTALAPKTAGTAQ